MWVQLQRKQGAWTFWQRAPPQNRHSIFLNVDFETGFLQFKEKGPIKLNKKIPAIVCVQMIPVSTPLFFSPYNTFNMMFLVVYSFLLFQVSKEPFASCIRNSPVYPMGNIRNIRCNYVYRLENVCVYTGSLLQLQSANIDTRAARA